MKDKLRDSYILCVCEGAAEQAIMEVLLENDLLLFNKTNLIENEFKRERSAKNIQTKYLNRSFSKDLYIMRILDSKKESLKLTNVYKKKIKETINIYTMPEIEMLVIISENHYCQYKNGRNNKMKPSQYCKAILRISDVKTSCFIKRYYKDKNKLIEALKLYNSYKSGDELGIFDLLK